MGAVPDVTPERGTSLTATLDGIARAALVVAGIIVFAPPGVMLLVNADTIGPRDWFVWVVPFALWLVGFAMRPLRTRAIVQMVAGMVFAELPLVVQSSVPAAWISLHVVLFAVGLAAAMSLSSRGAAWVIAFAVTVEAVSLVVEPAQLALPGPEAGGLAAPLFLAVTLGAFAVFMRTARAAAYETDTVAEHLRAASEARYRDAMHLRARAEVERAIHETVLNTLGAIARGGAGIDPRLVQESCRRDLERAAEVPVPARPVTLRALVDRCVVESGLSGVRLELVVADGVEVPAEVASPLRDALVECLRNVGRHARAARVTVTGSTRRGQILLSVADDGVGFVPAPSSRFGLSGSVEAPLEEVRGSVRVASRPGQGTTVTLRAPLTPLSRLSWWDRPLEEVFFGRVRARLLLLSPSLVTVLAVPDLVRATRWPVALVLAYLLYFAAGLALAVVWKAHRVSLAILAFLAGTGLVSTVTLGGSGCQSVSALSWGMTALVGGLPLILTALRGHLLQWGLVPVAAVLATGLAFTYPEACRFLPLMSAVSGLGFGVLAVVALNVFWNGFVNRRRAAESSWAEAMAAAAEADRIEVAAARWATVPASTWQLIRALAEGRVDARDEVVREQARVEEARIRAQLGNSGQAESSLAALARSAAGAAASAERTLDVGVMSSGGNREPLPEAVEVLVTGIATRAPSGSVSIRLVAVGGVEELVMSCRAEDLDAAWRLVGWGDAPGWQVDGVEASVARSGEQAVLNLRRRSTG